MTPPATTPTASWLSALPELPPLSGAAATAERLLLLLHYGVDWSTWVGDHRIHYWTSLLPDRVTKATYRSGTLDKWWSQVASDLQSAPRSAAERGEVALLLREQSGPVLAVLRDETPALLLRIRLTTDAVRQRRLTTLELQEPQP